MDNIFLKIINREIPADIIYEDDISIAFNDISPQAPTHILVIPKKEIQKISEADKSDKELLGHLLLVAKKITDENNIKDFRLVINNGASWSNSLPPSYSYFGWESLWVAARITIF